MFLFDTAVAGPPYQQVSDECAEDNCRERHQARNTERSDDDVADGDLASRLLDETDDDGVVVLHGSMLARFGS
jgi:hypothetical protein